jgi:hypothetical protein
MKNYNVLKYFIFIFILYLPVSGNGETVSQQTGVASPQSESEADNIELLRQRAISNAMDLAILHVTGAVVSGKRGSSYRIREDISTDGNSTNEEIKQQGRFTSAVNTRTEGYARLIEIVKEWQEDGQYYVTAEIAVENEEENLAQKNAGYYWKQAGEPSIHLSFTEEHNGEKTVGHTNRTFQYFRDNIIRNDITISKSGSTYGIEITQSLQSRDVEEFDTITLHCMLSYQIVDTDREKIIAEAKASHGPVAGFNYEQARERCLGSIAKDVSESLIRKLAEIMNHRWNNGVERNVVISSLPGDVVSRDNEIIQNLYGVTTSNSSRYENGNYTKKLTFKGSGAELADALTLAFEDEDWNITISSISENQVQFQWLGRFN